MTIIQLEDDSFYLEIVRQVVTMYALSKVDIHVLSNVPGVTSVADIGPDAVVMNLDMSGKKDSLLALASALQDDTVLKCIPVIALSVDIGLQDEALGRGCAHFLVKPFKVKNLCEALGIST
jgi:CheY-like chemotaxis protein